MEELIVAAIRVYGKNGPRMMNAAIVSHSIER